MHHCLGAMRDLRAHIADRSFGTGSDSQAPPLVDVLLTTYDAGATIRSAIDSVRRQTIRDIRIIVVDDGSKDETAAILHELEKVEPRLLVLSKANTGITDSLRVGLEHCRATFIARQDADDLSEPNRFELQLAYLDANPDCVAVSGHARHIDVDGRPTGHIARMHPPEAADYDWLPAREPHLIQPFLMMRRESFFAAGGYRPLLVSEDSDLYWRLQEVGRLHNIDTVLGSYRVHAGGITSSSLHHGRITALCSQRAALSARRRRTGRPDLQFMPADALAYITAPTLEALHIIGCRELDPDEQEMLRVAMAAKMIELCFYRLFEPDRADCVFIRKAVRDGLSRAKLANRCDLSEAVMTTSVRLASKGLIARSFLLLPWTDRPKMLARLAFRLGLPPRVRAFIKGAVK